VGRNLSALARRVGGCDTRRKGRSRFVGNLVRFGGRRANLVSGQVRKMVLLRPVRLSHTNGQDADLFQMRQLERKADGKEG